MGHYSITIALCNHHLYHNDSLKQKTCQFNSLNYQIFFVSILKLAPLNQSIDMPRIFKNIIYSENNSIKIILLSFPHCQENNSKLFFVNLFAFLYQISIILYQILNFFPQPIYVFSTLSDIFSCTKLVGNSRRNESLSHIHTCSFSLKGQTVYQFFSAF